MRNLIFFEQFPAGVTDLDTGLTDVDADGFTIFISTNSNLKLESEKENGKSVDTNLISS